MAHFQTSKTQILAFGPAQPKWDPTKGTNQYFNEHSLFQYNRFDKEPVTKDVALDDSSPTKGPADKSKEKVLVKLYTESECAECSRYTTTYVKQMLHHIGSIVDLKVVPFGKAVVSKEPSKKDLELDFKAGYKQLTSLSQVETMKKLYEDADHEVKTKGYVDADKVPIPVRFGCRHGFDECTANAWETCLQKVAPKHEDYFPVVDCMAARGCVEGEKAPMCVDTPARVVSRCLDDHGQRINTPELFKCYTTPGSMELSMLKMAVQTLEAKPVWLPWVTVDGEAVASSPGDKEMSAEEAIKSPAFREQFLLGKKICDVYVAKSGKQAPAGCSQLPQTDADIGEDPFAKFPKPDFTALIQTIEKEKEAQHEKEVEAAKWAAQPWYVRNAKLLAVAVPAMGIVSAGSWYFFYRKTAEQHQYDSLNNP